MTDTTMTDPADSPPEPGPDLSSGQHVPTDQDAPAGQDMEPQVLPPQDAPADTSSEDETTPANTEQAPDARASASSRVAELEREGEIAADFLETLLDIADVDGDLEVDVEGDRAAVAIVDSEEGRVPNRLVGGSAEVLEALQELTRLAVQATTGDRSRLMLDVAGYRAERRRALEKLAQQVIGEVKSTGERAKLEPMSAFERKVVHDEVLASGLSSQSEGDEPHRCVVVLPAP